MAIWHDYQFPDLSYLPIKTVDLKKNIYICIDSFKSQEISYLLTFKIILHLLSTLHDKSQNTC